VSYAATLIGSGSWVAAYRTAEAPIPAVCRHPAGGSCRMPPPKAAPLS